MEYSLVTIFHEMKPHRGPGSDPIMSLIGASGILQTIFHQKEGDFKPIEQEGDL